MTAKTLKDYADEWENLPWNLFQKQVFRLQHRIYEASKKGDKSLVKKIQNLLLSSRCCQYLTIKNLIELTLKKKAINDKIIKLLTTKHYFLLVENLKDLKLSKKKKLSDFCLVNDIDRKTYSMLRTLQQRSITYFVKYALEPVYNTNFYQDSYSQKLTDNRNNVKNALFDRLRSQLIKNREIVLIVSLTNCFTKTNYEKLRSFIILPTIAKKLLFSTLKRYILEKKYINLQVVDQETEIIYPILSSVLLYCIECINNENIFSVKNLDTHTGIRYENNIIFLLNELDDANKLIEKINISLEERGLDYLSAQKENFSCRKGFTFLDWHFVLKNKNLICYPAKNSVKKLVDKIKKTFKNSKYKLVKRLEIAKRIYYSWSLNYQYCDMSQISVSIWSLKNWSYKYLKKNSNMSKEERGYYIQMVFSKTKYFISRYSFS